MMPFGPWRIGATPTADLGGPRRAPALHLVEADVLGRRRPGRATGSHPRRRGDTATRWEAAADEIHADICANGLDQRGVFVQHYDTEGLDASVLLMPLVRFLPPDDQRTRDTVGNR
jgi:hypothetical protein